MAKHDEGCLKQKFPCCEDLMCPCDLAEFERMQAENARFREALEFYSIPNKTDEWACEDFGPYEDSESEPGHIAREALKGDV
jgi:hypothetical protein